MADPISSSELDPYKLLGFTRNPDGSSTRHDPDPTVPATPVLSRTTPSQPTLSKDIQLNSTTATFLRLFRPTTTTASKLPIIIYFHGGGFITSRATSLPYHNSCSVISSHTPALVISLDYRLAPEHRLPAAYDDAVEAVLWVRDQANLNINNGGGCDEWLAELADFSKVYLMGISAGANMVYHACLRSLDLDLNPIKIVGLITNQPFFGGVERTESELRLANDRLIPIVATDLMWSLALPEGSDRDHEYCNPLKHRQEGFGTEKIKRLPKCLVRGYDGDLMVDRQRQFADMLVAHGVHVTRRFYEGGYHGVDAFDDEGRYHGAELVNARKAQVTYDEVKAFVWSSY